MRGGGKRDRIRQGSARAGEIRCESQASCVRGVRRVPMREGMLGWRCMERGEACFERQTV